MKIEKIKKKNRMVSEVKIRGRIQRKLESNWRRGVKRKQMPATIKRGRFSDLKRRREPTMMLKINICPIKTILPKIMKMIERRPLAESGP